MPAAAVEVPSPEMPRRRTKRGSRPDSAGGRLRRPGLRRELRGPRGRARAGRLRSTGPDRRPLRGRRAPDVGLRRPHRVARGDGVEASIKQTFGELVIHTPHVTTRMRLPWTFSTFDYPMLCELLFEQCDAGFETAKVDGRDGRPTGAHGPGRPRGAAGGRLPRLAPRARPSTATSPRRRHSRAGWRCTPAGPRASSRSGSIEATCPPVTAGASPPRTRSGSGWARSTPASRVKDSTVRLARDLDRDPVRYQGNWIPHKLRRAAEDEVFFVGDSAGHCLPLTAEGIRTAFYFGIACGRELRAGGRRRATPRTRRCRATAPSPPRHDGSSNRCCVCSA